MICSHYDVKAFNKSGLLLAFAQVYSFDEAYYNIDNWRNQYPTSCKFTIEYPQKDMNEMKD